MSHESPNIDPSEAGDDKKEKPSFFRAMRDPAIVLGATGAILGGMHLANEAVDEKGREDYMKEVFNNSVGDNFGIRADKVEMQQDGSANVELEGNKYSLSPETVQMLTGKQLNHEQLRDPNVIQKPNLEFSLKWLGENGKKM